MAEYRDARNGFGAEHGGGGVLVGPGAECRRRAANDELRRLWGDSAADVHGFDIAACRAQPAGETAVSVVRSCVDLPTDRRDLYAVFGVADAGSGGFWFIGLRVGVGGGRDCDQAEECGSAGRHIAV